MHITYKDMQAQKMYSLVKKDFFKRNAQKYSQIYKKRATLADKAVYIYKSYSYILIEPSRIPFDSIALNLIGPSKFWGETHMCS